MKARLPGSSKLAVPDVTSFRCTRHCQRPTRSVKVKPAPTPARRGRRLSAIQPRSTREQAPTHRGGPPLYSPSHSTVVSGFGAGSSAGLRTQSSLHGVVGLHEARLVFRPGIAIALGTTKYRSTGRAAVVDHGKGLASGMLGAATLYATISTPTGKAKDAPCADTDARVCTGPPASLRTKGKCLRAVHLRA